MDREMEKAQDRGHMMGALVLGMTYGVWEIMEESATALTPTIGKMLLPMMEDLLNVKAEGETPADLLKVIGAMFTERLDWGSGYEVTTTGKSVNLILKDGLATDEIAGMNSQGMKFFSHPVLCAGTEALARKGIRNRPSLSADTAKNTQTITFELL
jgi:hypothetical protein